MGIRRRPITAHVQFWDVHFGASREIFRARLSSRKDQKGLEKWRPHNFRANYSVHLHAFMPETALSISLRKLPRRFNLLNGSRIYYKKIKCEKNYTNSSFTTYNPAVASPTEQLYEQMTSNPAVTKRNKQNSNAYILNINSCREVNSLVTYHTLPSLYVCVWLVNTLTSTQPIDSRMICT